MVKINIVYKKIVVYFDQKMGASHAVGWLKSKGGRDYNNNNNNVYFNAFSNILFKHIKCHSFRPISEV